MARFAKSEAERRPVVLTEIPRARWPATQLANPRAPIHAWESRKYLAQMYNADPYMGIEARRLSVCRVTLKEDGRWEENLSWDELMQVKREIGYGHWYALEVYPRDSDIVNVANMRHLWMFAEPIRIGWFSVNQS